MRRRPDVAQIGAEGSALAADRMAGGASSLPLEDGLPRGGIARSLLARFAGAEVLHERNHLPHFVVGGAYDGHLGSGNSIADGVEQVRVRAAPAVSAGGEIGAAAAFAARAVAVGAVNLKQSGALLHAFRRVESIDSILRPNGARPGRAGKSFSTGVACHWVEVYTANGAPGRGSSSERKKRHR